MMVSVSTRCAIARVRDPSARMSPNSTWLLIPFLALWPSSLCAIFCSQESIPICGDPLRRWCQCRGALFELELRHRVETGASGQHHYVRSLRTGLLEQLVSFSGTTALRIAVCTAAMSLLLLWYPLL